MKTIRYGDREVELLQRPWKRGKKMPYKKTYSLKPGDSWHDAEETADQWQYYVSQGAKQVPVGAPIAEELKKEGAVEAGFVELWGGCVIVDETLTCISDSGPIGQFIEEVKQLNNNSLAGFPDVVGIFEDGRAVLIEVKNLTSKDRLSPNQHELAKLLFKHYKDRVELKVLEWDPP